MNHDTYRKMLALRLYDELGTAQAKVLNGHLQGCAKCARFAMELDEGLGACARSLDGRTHDALPVGWLEALRQSVAAVPTHSRRRRHVVSAAASFFAGTLLMWVLSSGDPARETTIVSHRVTTRFELEGPPPRATPSGYLAELAIDPIK